MKKSLKIFAVVLLAMLVVFSVSTFSYAAGGITPDSVIGDMQADTSNIKVDGMKKIAARVLGLLQIVSAILAVVLIAYLGFTA